MLTVDVAASELMQLPSFAVASSFRSQFDDVSGGATVVAVVARFAVCFSGFFCGNLATFQPSYTLRERRR